MLKEAFYKLLKNYSNDQSLIDEYWLEVATLHSSNKRYYHTLDHLDNLLIQLIEVKDKVREWNTILFTLFYHDIVYNSLKSDNEEKSADLARKRMTKLLIPETIVKNCVAQILATKSHTKSSDNDINYFLDADLSVLGFEWPVYLEYSENVRKEYSIYPDIIYKGGRKKVLNHFIGMENIYKTAAFFSKYEKQAKENLKRELLLF